MIRTDNHIHTEFDHDGKGKTEEFVKSAVVRGMKHISFTMHSPCPNEIKTSFEDIKNKIENILNKYKETAARITVILQKQKIPMWNIIYITKKFNILNIKINAENGEVIEEKTVPLVSFERGGVKN